MADLRIRANGHSLARLVMAAGIDLAELPPGEDGWHTFDTMVDGLAAIKARNAARRVRAAARPAMTPDEAYESGRIMAASKVEWDTRYAADPERVGEALAELAPVLAIDDGVGSKVWATDPETGHAVLAARTVEPASSTPLLDQLDEAVYGPSTAERHRREDLEAERQLRDQIEAERIAASQGGLTADEHRQLFGPGAD